MLNAVNLMIPYLMNNIFFFLPHNMVFRIKDCIIGNSPCMISLVFCFNAYTILRIESVCTI